jgi:hypothetical protein
VFDILRFESNHETIVINSTLANAALPTWIETTPKMNGKVLHDMTTSRISPPPLLDEDGGNLDAPRAEIELRYESSPLL